jgi:hypothetical protein
MRKQDYAVIGFSILLLSSVAFAEDDAAKSGTKTWENYKAIAEKNIFSRSRTKAIPLSQLQQQVVVVPEQSYYSLRGITKESDVYIAFVEDSRSYRVTRARKGESVAGGKISDITMDDISYTLSGKTAKIEVGMNLEGQVASSGIQYASGNRGNLNGNTGFGSMGQFQQGGMPGGMQGSGMPGQGQQQGGMGQMPGGQASGEGTTTGQTQGGRGQGPDGMMGQASDQTQTTGQAQFMEQAQGGRGQGSFTMQSQTIGLQSQTPGQQSQTAGRTAASSQNSSVVQTGTQQQSESSDAILERLKERREKELEE